MDSRAHAHRPLMQMGGLRVHAGDRDLPWSRDLVDVFAFHVNVPEGRQTIDVSFSAGMQVKNDGTISDVVYGSPAYAAGLAPGMKITSINGRKYDGDVLREEIRAAKPIDVNVEQASFAGTFHVDYRGGEQFPHLRRIDGRPDLLSDIMRPHAPNAKVASARGGQAPTPVRTGEAPVLHSLAR